jgi:hypothetical protein
MCTAVSDIREIVDRETRAWDTQNVELLLSVFHPNMVWPWPRDPVVHDPMDWVLTQGRFDHDRWTAGWTKLFSTHRFDHNRRTILKIVVSEQEDAGFAVVDIDTLWIHRTMGKPNHWLGRACKVYSLTRDGWRMTMHTGVLQY